jgi:rhodanese-related sulfurtransferase
MKVRLFVFSALAVLMLTGCAGLGTSPKGLELPIEKASIKLVSDAKEGGYRLVGTEELNKWIAEKKDVLIIDTMPKPDFEKLHIGGAVNAPMPKTEAELTPADKQGLLKVAGNAKERTVVAYCGFTACRRSHFGAKLLVENGFANVYRYPAGIVGWKEAGFPTNK